MEYVRRHTCDAWRVCRLHARLVGSYVGREIAHHRCQVVQVRHRVACFVALDSPGMVAVPVFLDAAVWVLFAFYHVMSWLWIAVVWCVKVVLWIVGAAVVGIVALELLKKIRS